MYVFPGENISADIQSLHICIVCVYMVWHWSTYIVKLKMLERYCFKCYWQMNQGPFIIKDLPSMLVLIIADQIQTVRCVVLTNTTDVYV